MNSDKIRIITRTGLGLALVLLAQALNKVIPAIPVFAGVQLSQLVTGTLVNALLLIISIDAGYKSGVFVGILSAVLATLLGIGPIFPIITPFIAIGNVLFVLAYCYVKKLNFNHYIAFMPAALLKAGFLWVSIPIVLQYIPDIAPMQVKMLSLMFSWPQLITALCGGLFAGTVISRVNART